MRNQSTETRDEGRTKYVGADRCVRPEQRTTKYVGAGLAPARNRETRDEGREER